MPGLVYEKSQASHHSPKVLLWPERTRIYNRVISLFFSLSSEVVCLESLFKCFLSFKGKNLSQRYLNFDEKHSSTFQFFLHQLRPLQQDRLKLIKLVVLVYQKTHFSQKSQSFHIDRPQGTRKWLFFSKEFKSGNFIFFWL